MRRMMDEVKKRNRRKYPPDALAMERFGMTVQDAQDAEICVQCKEPVALSDGVYDAELYTEMLAYRNYGLCLGCFEPQMKEEKDARLAED